MNKNNYYNEAIKKAIEGGYNKRPSGYDDDKYRMRVILDPLFWQALGKALGWGIEFADMVCCICGTHCFRNGDRNRTHFMERPIYLWQHYAHQYFDLVLTGRDTDKFWKELLNNPYDR